LNLKHLNIRQYHQLSTGAQIVRGIGSLTPKQIGQYKPQAFTLTTQQIQYALDVWAAITDASPQKLTTVLNRTTTTTTYLPLLHTALSTLIYRYPDITKGLSLFDEILLEGVSHHWPKAGRVIGYALSVDQSDSKRDQVVLDTVGDLYLFHRLKKMANSDLNRPLLALNSTTNTLQQTEVELTDFGQRVLKGEENAVTTNGIDDQVCGVKLDSASNNAIWFRKQNEIVEVNQESN